MLGSRGHGIAVGDHGLVTDCSSGSNAGDGIRVQSECIVRGNVSTENGAGGGIGAGIHVVGLGGRIEGNACTASEVGIDVDAANNVIVRNTCSANTVNWEIVPSNAVAPIVLASKTFGTISGDTFGGSLGSTDPNANFTH